MSEETENREEADALVAAGDESREEPSTTVEEVPAEEGQPDAPEEGVSQEEAVEKETTDASDEAATQDLADQLLRARAELDNYRKRAAREKEEAVRWAGGSVLRDLVPVLDNFQMGLESARAEDDGSMIFKGMEMVARQFSDFFDSHGVEIVDPSGEAFDAARHEAVSTEASEEVPDGHVLRVVRLGYVLRERLLRPANVVVSTGPASADAGDSGESGEASKEEAS